MTEQDGLEDELAALTREWSVWIAEVGQWTPGSNEPPPERPTWRYGSIIGTPSWKTTFSASFTSAILIPPSWRALLILNRLVSPATF